MKNHVELCTQNGTLYVIFTSDFPIPGNCRLLKAKYEMHQKLMNNHFRNLEKSYFKNSIIRLVESF